MNSRSDTIFNFPTWKDEQQMITRGRFTLFLLSAIVTVIVFCFFQVKFDVASFWIIRLNNRIQLNLPHAALIVFLLLISYMHIEPFFLRIKRVTIPAKRLTVPSLRIAHISDTHIHFPYPQVTAKRMRRIVDQINSENPDIVVFTGDLMSDDSKYSSKDISAIANSLRNLKVPLFVCFGNHDVDCRNALSTSLTNIGAKVLEQETVEFPISGSKIYISGLKPSLKLFESVELVDHLKSNFNGDRNLCHILLAHMPDVADAACQSGLFDLQLSGHSHGGQCVLPLSAGTPLLPPGSLKYHGCVEQTYRVNDMVLHVSRGVGVTPLPFPLIRFLCPPEFSILTLIPPRL